MPLHLITGHKGEAHISSADVGAFNAGVFGQGEYVLNTGQKFKIEVLSNNAVKIHDGDLIMQGRHISLKSGSSEELTIDNGTADLNRIDLIVVRYTQDIETGIENAEFAVIKGTPAVEAVAPEYTTGDILSGGCVLHEMPLYKIPLTGLTVNVPQALYKIQPNIDGISTALIYKGVFSFEDGESDIPSVWKTKGNGVWYLDSNTLTNQPFEYGFFVSLYDDLYGDFRQFIIDLDYGSVFTRKNIRNNWDEWNAHYDAHTLPMVTGNYIGDGAFDDGRNGYENIIYTTDSYNRNFTAKFVCIKWNNSVLIWVRGADWAGWVDDEGNTHSVSVAAENGRFIYWSDESAKAQMNASTGKYYYFVHG